MRRYLVVGLLLLAALFNSQMDTILFRPSQAWFDGWWIASNSQQPFWQKYLLPMTVDGWHFVKFLFLSTIMCYIVIKEELKWYWWFIVMIIWGLLFNLFYYI